MRPDPILPVFARDGAGNLREGFTQTEFAEGVGELGYGGDDFIIVQRNDDDDMTYFQLCRLAADRYQVEHQMGSTEQHYCVELETPAEVAALMTGWALRIPGWDAGYAWEREEF